MTPIEITGLQVIGYADRLRRGTTPRKVAPIYRRQDGSFYVFPPHVLVGNHICNATLGKEADFAERTDAYGDWTELPEAIPAQPDAILWIDHELIYHYGPRPEMLAQLRNLSKKQYQEAKTAFAQKHYGEAQQLARFSFAADERAWVALALQAAVDRINNNCDGAEELKAIAADIIAGDEFEQRVEAFLLENMVTMKSFQAGVAKNSEGQGLVNLEELYEGVSSFLTGLKKMEAMPSKEISDHASKSPTITRWTQSLSASEVTETVSFKSSTFSFERKEFNKSITDFADRLGLGIVEQPATTSTQIGSQNG